MGSMSLILGSAKLQSNFLDGYRHCILCRKCVFTFKHVKFLLIHPPFTAQISFSFATTMYYSFLESQIYSVNTR